MVSIQNETAVEKHRAGGEYFKSYLEKTRHLKNSIVFFTSTIITLLLVTSKTNV